MTRYSRVTKTGKKLELYVVTYDAFEEQKAETI